MTVTEIREIFKTQLDQNPKDLFYLVHDNTTASVIRHRLDQKSLEDLAQDLTGLTHDDFADAVPKFRRTP